MPDRHTGPLLCTGRLFGGFRPGEELAALYQEGAAGETGHGGVGEGIGVKPVYLRVRIFAPEAPVSAMISFSAASSSAADICFGR